jgi:hypothetical protein
VFVHVRVVIRIVYPYISCGKFSVAVQAISLSLFTF